MDPTRFDMFTKSFISRRTAVRGLMGAAAGSLLGGVLALRGGRPAAAAGCADICAALPAGTARDDCLAACADGSRAGSLAAAAITAGSDAVSDVGDAVDAIAPPDSSIFCRKETVTCYWGPYSNRVGNLGQKHSYCIHPLGLAFPRFPKSGCDTLRRECGGLYPLVGGCKDDTCGAYVAYKGDGPDYGFQICPPKG